MAGHFAGARHRLPSAGLGAPGKFGRIRRSLLTAPRHIALVASILDAD
jgi:hypothetical protein